MKSGSNKYLLNDSMNYWILKELNVKVDSVEMGTTMVGFFGDQFLRKQIKWK